MLYKYKLLCVTSIAPQTKKVFLTPPPKKRQKHLDWKLKSELQTAKLRQCSFQRLLTRLNWMNAELKDSYIKLCFFHKPHSCYETAESVLSLPLTSELLHEDHKLTEARLHILQNHKMPWADNCFALCTTSPISLQFLNVGKCTLCIISIYFTYLTMLIFIFFPTFAFTSFMPVLHCICVWCLCVYINFYCNMQISQARFNKILPSLIIPENNGSGLIVDINECLPVRQCVWKRKQTFCAAHSYMQSLPPFELHGNPFSFKPA